MELDKKKMIESALFISARCVGLDELARLVGLATPGFARKILDELKCEYTARQSPIEIVEIDGKWLMRIKDEYIEKVRAFAQQTELSKTALRTLAYIAKHDGIIKSEVARKIGSQIYQDVRELTQSGFINQIKNGRSAKLFLTNKFKQYFKTENIN
ncbi:MAG: SMC-Scp complex subunit ScpB [Candidatus Micrarchaeota archaeon]